MIGCRPLSRDEFERVARSFQGRFAKRNAALFVLGSTTGFRIGELRSIRVGDVYQYDQILDFVSVRRSAMKGKHEGRTVILHREARRVLLIWFSEMRKLNWLDPDSYLFRSQVGGNRPISSAQAARILKRSFYKQRMTGKLSCHSMRKFFAQSVFELLGGDLVKLQRALGHKNVTSTMHYLSFRQEDIDRAVLAI